MDVRGMAYQLTCQTYLEIISLDEHGRESGREKQSLRDPHEKELESLLVTTCVYRI